MDYKINNIYLNSLNFENYVSADDSNNLQDQDREIKLEVKLQKTNETRLSLRNDDLQFGALIAIPIELNSEIFKLNCRYSILILSPTFQEKLTPEIIKDKYLDDCIRLYLQTINSKIHSFLKQEISLTLPEDNFIFKNYQGITSQL